MHAKRQSSSETTHVVRQRSVTYVKSFLRAFTREKRYQTCFKFRFVSSPLSVLKIPFRQMTPNSSESEDRYSQAKGAPDNWIYLLNFWTRTFNRTSAPVAGIRSDCTRTTIPCNALHSTSAKNSGFSRSGPSAMTNSAKAERRAVGVSSLAT